MDLHSVNLLSITLRLGLAALFGLIIGVERESSKHPAGLRTHMLICIGSTLAMLTNQYVSQTISPGADPTRIGAQVISGIGFLGAGTIMIVGRQHIKGLTTAAGLWASACMGLAIGIGFYTGAIIGGIFILTIIAGLHSFDTYIAKRSRSLDIYVEVDAGAVIPDLQEYFQLHFIVVTSMHMNRADTINDHAIGLTMSLKLPQQKEHQTLIAALSAINGVCLVQQI